MRGEHIKSQSTSERTQKARRDSIQEIKMMGIGDNITQGHNNLVYSPNLMFSFGRYACIVDDITGDLA